MNNEIDCDSYTAKSVYAVLNSSAVFCSTLEQQFYLLALILFSLLSNTSVLIGSIIWNHEVRQKLSTPTSFFSRYTLMQSIDIFDNNAC